MRMKNVAVICSLLLIATSAVGFAAQSTAVRVGTEAEARAAQTAMLDLHARLVADQVELGTVNPLIIDVNVDALAAMNDTTAEKRMRVGVVAPVEAAVVMPSSATSKAFAGDFGAIVAQADRMVWTTAVESFGATGIRLHITGLDLPKGVELAIYNDRGEAFAYTGRGTMGTGDFWTNTVSGGSAYLQLTGADITAVDFQIADLGYLGSNWVYGAHAGLDKSHCSYNASCVDNAGCGGSNAVSAARDAVGHMQYVSGPYLYVCSGGLLNNDAGRPYFLTAHHCISKGGEASSLETYFAYEIGCNDSCPTQWSQPNTPRVSGSSIVSKSRTSDYTLLELNGSAAGTVMLGWNSNEVAFSGGTNLYRISHPSAAPQAYSEQTVDTSKGTCRSWPRGSWIYSKDTSGATEGGSSGSPVVNGSGQVVGQLSGACGTNLNNVCDSNNNATVDGAFAAYYNDIAGFLGGGGPTCDPAETCGDGVDNDCNGQIDDGCGGPGCTDNDADGVCVEDGDCDDNNNHVYPGHNDSRGKWGRDGLDNDCNGTIDG